MRRSLLLFLTGYLLHTLVAHANHELSPAGISIFLGGLFVVYAAFHLERREGLLAVFGAGLLHDAAAPVWFGTHALLFSVAHVTIYHFRNRLPREEMLIAMMIALLANLGIFMGLSLTVIAHSPTPSRSWPRLLMELLTSQAVLVVVTPWFLSLQAQSLKMWGGSLRQEPRGLR